MEFRFSEHTLQRGTFPWERDAHGAVDNYSATLNGLSSSVQSNELLGHRIRNLHDLLSKHSSSISDGIAPDWVRFIDTLIPEKNHPSKLHHTYDDLLCGLHKNAYFSPFLNAAKDFLVFLQNTLSNTVIAGGHSHQLHSKITEFYLSRLVETSRFVLHVKFSQSNLGYSSWCKRFESSAFKTNPWLSITEEYPLLIRWLATIDRNVRSAISELFDRFTTDRDEISSTFNLDTNAKIIDIKLGLSDPHRKGRGVTILTFDNGERLVYKPKPLDIDCDLYDFFTNKLTDKGIISIKVLAKEGYGWAEHKSYAPTQSMSRDEAFAIGQASAFFWLLNSTDLHSENVFSNKSGVFALDLETLLLAPAKKNQNYSSDFWRNHSIYTTMLFDFSFGEQRKQNISGFDPSDNLTTIAPKIVFNIVNDAIVIDRIKPADEIPAYTDSDNEKSPNISCILEGFDSVTMDKETIKKINEFVHEMNQDNQMRIVFRDTYFYDRILDKMRQPRFMRDGALLYMDLFKLHIGLLNSSANEETLHALVEDEISQLLEGDIPYFSNKVGHCNLQISTGELTDFFSVSSAEHSLNKIRSFEQSDVEEQKSLIQVALGNYHLKPREKAHSYSELNLQSFQSLSHHIINSAFCPRDSLSRWISMFGDVAGREARIFIGDKGYFSGSLGILLALQATEMVLSKYGVSDDTIADFLNHQSAFYRDFLQQTYDQKSSEKRLLGFSGVGGEILAHSILLKSGHSRWSFLDEYIKKALTGVEEQIRSDKWLDVIGGSAGLLLGCQHLLAEDHEGRFISQVETIRHLCASHLVSQAQPYNDGLAWVIPNEEMALVGFAHGSAGIVSALSSLPIDQLDLNLRNSLSSTLEKASTFFDDLLEKDNEWLDFRGGERKALNRSWCNGVPGVLRGLISIDHYWTAPIEEEFNTLLNKTVSLVGSSETYRLCCGEMGNIDFLFDYAQSLDHQNKKKVIEKIYPITENILQKTLINADTLVPELAFPGLFHGQAGMLYTASRFFMPELPSLTGHKFTTSKKLGFIPT